MSSRLSQLIEQPQIATTTPTSGSRLSLLTKNLPQQEIIPETVSVFPSTREMLAELKIDPLSLKAKPKEVLGAVWEALKHPILEAGKDIKDLFTTATTKPKVIGKELEIVADIGGIVFSPISALFEGANKIPVLGSVSKLIGTAFIAAGEGANVISNKVIDELPISDEHKTDIREGVNEITALAAQLALGKITHIAKKKTAGLVKRFGEKDTQTIINKANEFAKQAKEPVPTEMVKPEIEPTISKTKPISQMTMAEAKTAKVPFDEWVKGQGEFFHGTSDKIEGKLGDKTKGVWLAEDVKIADKYVGDGVIGANGEVYYIKPISKLKIKDIYQKGEFSSFRELTPELEAKLAKEGYDGIRLNDAVRFEKDLGSGVFLDKEYHPSVRIFAGSKNKLQSVPRSELKAEWKGIKEVKPTRKYIEIPREQLPVKMAEAEKGVSALEARMKGLFETQNVKKAKAEAEARGLDISIYDKMSKPEQIRNAAKYVSETSQYKVLEILEGKREAPKGLLHNAIMLALEEKSLRDKNVNLSIKLASLRSTRMGQEISILTEVSGLSPVSGMDAIIRARRSFAEKKLPQGQKLSQKAETMKTEIKTEIKAKQMKMSEVAKFLSEITCK